MILNGLYLHGFTSKSHYLWLMLYAGRRTTNHLTITKHNSYIHMCCFKHNKKQQNIAMVLWVTVLELEPLIVFCLKSPPLTMKSLEGWLMRCHLSFSDLCHLDHFSPSSFLHSNQQHSNLACFLIS